jgi:ethylbenzene dioxygenase ferredoxin component
VVVLCRVDELDPDQPLGIDRDGLPPIAVYQVGDEILATSNVCTHSYSLLSEGFQEDDEIECAVHGGRFDIRTGEATAFPCAEPLRTYPVTVVDGQVTIPAGALTP